MYSNINIFKNLIIQKIIIKKYSNLLFSILLKLIVNLYLFKFFVFFVLIVIILLYLNKF